MYSNYVSRLLPHFVALFGIPYALVCNYYEPLRPSPSHAVINTIPNNLPYTFTNTTQQSPHHPPHTNRVVYMIEEPKVVVVDVCLESIQI